MIQQPKSLGQLLPFDVDAFGCSVISTATAYGMDTEAAQFWHGSGFAVRRQDSTVTLCGTVRQEDKQELRAFLPCIGMQTLVCSRENAQTLALETAETGIEMELAGKISAPKAELHFATTVPDEDALNLTEMHHLLVACKTPDFVPPPFEPFYLDMSHRIRHGAAIAAGAYLNGKLCACAAAALSQKRMLLFSGAALPQVRGSGAFAAVLAGLAERAGERTVSLLCGEKLQRHYEAIGFVGLLAPRLGDFLYQQKVTKDRQGLCP